MTDLEQLKKIERIINEKLTQYTLDKNTMEWTERCGYRLNNEQQVISLNLRDCKLENINFLASLKNLTRLDLRYNQLRDISILKELNGLTKLLLGHNKINKIEPLKELINLTLLDLSVNQLSEISALKELKNLTKLDLQFNRLRVLPEWLLEFDLAIKWKSNYSYNNKVFVAHNPLEKPPPEVIKNGNDAIRNYFTQIKQQGTDSLYEAKLILIGEGGAGKTSLANKIINPKYQLLPENESESTLGIDILRYEFPYQDKTFRVNIWDFGGQEIYHQTHQFFLSKRSLCFVVADNRKEDTDFYYWLNTVEMFSDNSPLLIIKNEKGKRARQIPEKQLKSEFDNIKEVLATNLSDNSGLATIIKNLQHYITQLPHIGTPLPKTWTKVREQLERDSRYYIGLKEYFELCQTNGFTKETDKLQLSGYLHDLGVCLHFQEDDLLSNTLILKPTWATDAVYKVLDNRKVVTNFGRFNKDDLKNIWQDFQYSYMRGELLALMLNFKLCFEIPNKAKHYIAPQLLENNAPDYPWQEQDNLLLRYQYDFMPKGLVSQFIVVMHEHIAHDYQWVWKGGVVLVKGGAHAEIIEYYSKREIHIRVSRQHKKGLLEIVSYELDKINDSYERLKGKYKKLIPCSCKKCLLLENPHFYDYEKLKERVVHSKYTIECGNPPYTDVDILQLVDDRGLTGFKNYLEQSSSAKDNSQYVHVTVNTNQENKEMTESRTVNTSNYIEGDMNGGNVAGRDINTQNNQGMTKEEFVALLQSFKQDLALSGLQGDDIEAITDDIDSLEKQLQKDEPKKSLVSRKVASINGILDDANSAIDTVEKSNKTLDKLVATGKILTSSLEFLI